MYMSYVISRSNHFSSTSTGTICILNDNKSYIKGNFT